FEASLDATIAAGFIVPEDKEEIMGLAAHSFPDADIAGDNKGGSRRTMGGDTQQYPRRSMGSSDPKVNLVLDAQPQGIRVLPPVPLYPKGGAGFEDWPGRLEGAEEASKNGGIFNVIEPSFQAFLPPVARNTRTAVVIAPGGGFRMLSINSEGNDLAQWLA